MSIDAFKNKLISKGCNIEVKTIKTKLFGESTLERDQHNVENRDIEVFYMFRKSKLENAKTIIFFNGGPGIGLTQQFFEHNAYNDFLVDYNFVFMDQRGTGFSEKAGDNLYEYGYFSSRYITYDADLIRRELLGDKGKWIVFGQSFGGHLVRKYLEHYSHNAIKGISHGYGECSPILMKANIEKELIHQVRNYFRDYPNDEIILNEIKSMLDENDVIGDESRCLEGKGIMDVFSFYFGLYSFSKINRIIQSLDRNNLKEAFINEISYLGNLILKSGILNAVVAYIDLVDGLSDDALYTLTEEQLKKENVFLSNQLFSTIRLSKNIISKDNRLLILEDYFNKNKFTCDPLDFSKLCSGLKKHKVDLHVIASRNDSLTPVAAIKDEEALVSTYDIGKYYRFIYSDGNHREWKDNKGLIQGIVEDTYEEDND